MAMQTFETTVDFPFPANIPREDAAKATKLRQACLKYEAQRRDIEAQFDTALAALRERYLSEILKIHSAA